VPNLAAGTDTCTLTAPAHVISATGRQAGGDPRPALRQRHPRRVRQGPHASRSARPAPGASTVTVARGHAKAERAGTVRLRVKPTRAAKRAAKRMRKVVLTIKVSQPGAAGKATVRLK
jgi:hypothetical protein